MAHVKDLAHSGIDLDRFSIKFETLLAPFDLARLVGDYNSPLLELAK